MQIFSDEFKSWIATELENGQFEFSCKIDKDDIEIVFTSLQLSSITPHTVQFNQSDLRVNQDFFSSNDDFIIDARL